MKIGDPALQVDEEGWQRAAYWALLATAFSIAFSIAAGQICLGVCSVALVVGLVRARRMPSFPALAWLALIFSVLALMTAAWGPKSLGIGRNSVKVLWFLLVPAAASLVPRSRRLPVLLKAFILGCGVEALQILVLNSWRAWHDRPDFFTALINRGSMTGGQMLMLGILATVGLIIARRQERQPCGSWILLLLLQAAALLINFKRGSWVCAVAMVGALLALRGGWRYWVAVIVAILVGLALPPVRGRLAQIPREFQSAQGGGRMTMWCKIAPVLVREYPQGIGYGAMNGRLMKSIAPEVESNRSHLHSNPVQILVETGWAGLSLYMLWMLVAFGQSVRLARGMRDQAPEISLGAVCLPLMLLGLFANGLVEYNFGDTELMIVYAMLFGVIGAGQRWSAGYAITDEMPTAR